MPRRRFVSAVRQIFAGASSRSGRRGFGHQRLAGPRPLILPCGGERAEADGACEVIVAPSAADQQVSGLSPYLPDMESQRQHSGTSLRCRPPWWLRSSTAYTAITERLARWPAGPAWIRPPPSVSASSSRAGAGSFVMSRTRWRQTALTENGVCRTAKRPIGSLFSVSRSPHFALTVALCLHLAAGTVVSWSQAFENSEFAGRVEHVVVPAGGRHLDPPAGRSFEHTGRRLSMSLQRPRPATNTTPLPAGAAIRAGRCIQALGQTAP